MNSVRKLLTLSLVSLMLTQAVVAQSISTNALKIQCEDQVFALNTGADDPKCMANIQLRAMAYNDPTCSASALISWIVYVDKDGNGVDDLEFSSFVSPMDVDLTTDSNGNGIMDYYLAPSKEGEAPSMPEWKWPTSFNSHKILWNAVDSCGNRVSCYSIVKVKDLDPPTIDILLSDTIDANGGERREITAARFNIASHDNCTANEKLWFTFDGAYPVPSLQNTLHYFKGKGINAEIHEYNQGKAQYWNPALNTSSKMLICDGSGNKTVSQQISIWDEYLNTETAFAQIFLSRFDCVENCLSGKVTNLSNQSIPHVFASIERIGRDDYRYFVFSEEYKVNLFVDWYKVKLKKRNDYRNGITGADLLILLRHINGQELLDSPEKLLAADINADGKITMEDFHELYELRTGIKDTFNNNDSWIFLPQPYSFKDVNHPYDINRTAMVDLAVQTQQDFKGIKVGDVDQITIDTISNEPIETIQLTTDDRWVQHGDKIEVAIYTPEHIDLKGWEIKLALKDIQAIHIKPGIKSSFQGALFDVDSIYTSTVAVKENAVLEPGTELLRITGIAKKEGLLSSFFQMAYPWVNHFYVGNKNRRKNVNLSFVPTGEKQKFTLKPVTPNPFYGVAEVKYYLPSFGTIKYAVCDPQGKTLFNRTELAIEGENFLRINSTDLVAEGLYYLSITFQDQIQTVPLVYSR
jgi:hypothetical protein